MKNSTLHLGQLIQYFDDFFERITIPNTKYAQNQVDHELAHKRIKIGVLFHVFFASFLILQLLTGTNKMEVTLILIASNVVYIAALTILRTFHPKVLWTIYHILLSSFVFILGSISEDGAQRLMCVVTIYPNFLFLLTGSLGHFIVQAIIQAISLNLVYLPLLVNNVKGEQSEAFIQSTVLNTNKLILYNIIVTFGLQSYLKVAHRKIYEAEKSRVEFENQKTFLLGFSHELRNLLNSLIGNIKLATFESLTSKAEEHLKNASFCGELLNHLVNNILDTGKAEIGDLEINPIAVNVCEMFGKIWSMCSDIIGRKNLRGSMRIDKCLPKAVKIDHYRLTQIILNLVGNAVKFTDSGSVDVTVKWLKNEKSISNKCFEPYPYGNDQDEFNEGGTFERDQCFSLMKEELISLTLSNKEVGSPQIFQSDSSTQGVLKITVKDTGCGISSSDIPRLFKKFVQVSPDSLRRSLGTGLGLFITRQICEKMHGEVRVYSRKDQGSCFVVCIPIESIGILNRRSGIESPVQLNNLKAMVVDDEHLSCMILKTFLLKMNVSDIQIAKNGLEGLKRYVDGANRNTQVDVVLLDIEMPIMNGKEAAEQIRKLELQRRLKPCLIIIISGNCSAAEISECLDVNGRIKADAFLKKPVSFEEIRKVISGHFQSE